MVSGSSDDGRSGWVIGVVGGSLGGQWTLVGKDRQGQPARPLDMRLQAFLLVV